MNAENSSFSLHRPQNRGDTSLNRPSAQMIADWLVTEVVRRFDVDRETIDIDRPLVRYGLDSIAALELVAALEDWLGQPLPLTLMWDHPTMGAIARHIANELLAWPNSLEADMRSWIGHEELPQPLLLRDDVYEHPISHGQRTLWTLMQSSPKLTLCNLTSAVHMRSELDMAALQWAFQQVVNRHSGLRTTFALSEGQPVQRVHKHMAVCPSEANASAWSEEFLHYSLCGEAGRPFDLERGPLLRLQLFKRAPNEHIFLLVIHQIVADFWSMVVVMHELELLYEAAKSGAPNPLPPLVLQFADFVQWQTEMLANPEGAQLWDYWKQQLSGALAPLPLPIDRQRPAWHSYRGASQPLKLGTALTEKLKALSHETDSTLFTTLLATLYMLLYHYTDREDLIIGSHMTGRSRVGWLDAVGHFVNPVVLRTCLEGNPTFVDLIERVKQTLQGAFEHQDYPFGLLVERLQPHRDLGRLAFPQVMLVWKKAHRHNSDDFIPWVFEPAAMSENVTLTSMPPEFVPLEQQVSQCDLNVTIGEVDGTLSGSMRYNTGLFDPTTIARMRHHYQMLLNCIVADPTQRLATILMVLDSN